MLHYPFKYGLDVAMIKNDSYLWSRRNKSSVSSLSETSTIPLSPIYTSVFFEYSNREQINDLKLTCIDFILWQRLSYQFIYPNVIVHRHNSSASSKSGSLIKNRNKSKNATDCEVAELSFSSLNKTFNDFGDLLNIPLESSLVLLSRTRNAIPDAAWYFNYLDSVSVKLVLGMRMRSFCLLASITRCESRIGYFHDIAGLILRVVTGEIRF